MSEMPTKPTALSTFPQPHKKPAALTLSIGFHPYLAFVGFYDLLRDVEA